MAYEVNYADIGNRAARDDAAIADLRAYVSADAFTFLVEYAEGATLAEHIPPLRFALSTGGISGLPFHAFCRRYCLAAYRAWMHEGEDAIHTDEQGFPLQTDQYGFPM